MLKLVVSQAWQKPRYHGWRLDYSREVAPHIYSFAVRHADVDGDVHSGVIVEYLIEKYGNGRFVTPTGDKQKQLDDRYFQHFAEGSMMPYLVMKLLFMGMQARSPFFIRPIATLLSNGVDSAFIGPNIKSCMQLVSDTLTKDGGRQWLAGGSEPTGADFMMSFPLEWVQQYF